MKIFKVSSLVSIAAASAALSICANVVSMDFTKVHNKHHAGLVHRALVPHGTQIIGTEDDLQYGVEVQIGTPPQKVWLTIDTGSTDTWVMTDAPGNPCTLSNSSMPCEGELIFHPENSTTYHEVVGDNLTIEYGGGMTVSGPFFEDTFVIGDSFNLTSLQMGLALNSSNEAYRGTLGLSYDTDESGTENGSPVYSSFIDKLVSEKFINSPLYSLSLSGGDVNTGSITFGGIDTDKFVGELLSTPVVPYSIGPSETIKNAFFVDLISFGVNGKQDTLLQEPVLLDSGTSLTYLPSSIVDPLVETYNGQWMPDEGLYQVNCDSQSQHADDYFDFHFAPSTQAKNGSGSGGPSIRVPFSGVFLNLGNESCWLGIVSSGFNNFSTSSTPSPNVLGDTFLRSAYVVYDLKNQEIGLAQAYASNSSLGSSFVEIAANATTIPQLCGRNSSSCSMDKGKSEALGLRISSGLLFAGFLVCLVFDTIL